MFFYGIALSRQFDRGALKDTVYNLPSQGFRQDLINAFKTNEKVCDHIHLPVQSGSDRVLKRMNRKYTKELYLDKIAKLKDTCPG